MDSLSEFSNTKSTISKDKKELNLNEIMEKGDNTKYSIYALLKILSVLFIDGLEKMIYVFLIIPLNEYFHFKEFESELCSSIIFLGLSLGSISSGYLTKYFKREKVLKICSFQFVILHLFYSIFFYKAIFFICRLLIGFLLGIYTPICLNLYCEYLPSKNRGFRLQVVWVAYSISNIIFLFIVILFMPKFEIINLKKVLLISEIIPLISFIINISTLYDSPRHLIINNENEEAFKILDNMNKEKLTEEEKNKIINEIKNNQISNNGDIKEMYNDYYRKTSLIIILEYFITACGCFGIPIITTLTTKQFNLNKGKEDNFSIIITQLIIALIGLISNIFAGFLVNIKYLGRKGSLILSLVLEIILVTFAINLPKFFPLLIGFSQFFANIFANILIAYNSEVYNTKIRDIACGFNLMIYRFFCMCSQFMFLQLNLFNYKAPYYSLGILSLFALIFIYLLPYETMGKDIDSKFEDCYYLKFKNDNDEEGNLLKNEE